MQKAAFFSLSPEEQKLVGADTVKPETPAPAQGSGSPRWYALHTTFAKQLTVDSTLSTFYQIPTSSALNHDV